MWQFSLRSNTQPLRVAVINKKHFSIYPIVKAFSDLKYCDFLTIFIYIMLIIFATFIAKTPTLFIIKSYRKSVLGVWENRNPQWFLFDTFLWHSKKKYDNFLSVLEVLEVSTAEFFYTTPETFEIDLKTLGDFNKLSVSNRTRILDLMDNLK